MRKTDGVAGTPSGLDLGVMALLLVPSLAQVLLVPIGPRPLGVAFALASVGPLAWRRTRPVGAATVHMTAWTMPATGFDGFLVLGFVASIILLFSVGLYVSSSRRTAALVAYGLLVGTTSAFLGPDDPIGVLSVWLVTLAPVAAGRLLAQQREQNRRLEELTRRLEIESDLSRRTAVAEERSRIARELHDVVGHEMTMIAIQSEAAAAALAVAPERAHAPVEAIRITAHRAGAEVRSILGLLRTDGEDLPGPVPRPAEVVRRACDHGLAVHLVEKGVVWTDESAVHHAVSRVLQESMTNARRHASDAPVRACLRWNDDLVRLTVDNELPDGHVHDAGSGLGLIGMTERARLLGGTLCAGVRGADWRVELVLPRRAP
ncbi:MAG: histidine kinase [Nocardioides sp.]